MGISGDWRDTFWGHMILVAVVLAAASAAIGLDSKYRLIVRVFALTVLPVAVGLGVYALLRVLRVLPVVTGRRGNPDGRG